MVAPVVDLTARGGASGKYWAVSGIPTQLLVLHSAECPLRGGYARSLTEWALTTSVTASWHRFVDPIHRVRMIHDSLGAWHASEANPLSIGWEQAGYARFSRAEWTTPDGMKQLDNLAYDMAEVAKRDGIPPVWLTYAQVRAVLDSGNRSIKGFCAHRQIDPETRTDPGDGYPYDLLMNKIKAYMGVAVPKPVPTPKPKPKPPIKVNPAGGVAKTNYVPDFHWRVDPGETLGGIAQALGTTVPALVAWNGIKNANRIVVGERIWKPGHGYGTWTMERGDTLGEIVAWVKKNWKVNVTVKSLCYANGINDVTKIPVGLRLKIA